MSIHSSSLGGLSRAGQRPIVSGQPARARTPESVTHAASTQTFFTIRLLADETRRHQAYEAYAYFRWLDDALDRPEHSAVDRIALAARQADLIERAYAGASPTQLGIEERWLTHLIGSDPDPTSGLATYIRRLFSVMDFDARRRGRLISAAELDAYTLDLAIGVTEAMHYFIGHDKPAPQGAWRYRAVIGAHITHMLRDTVDDLAAGYYNIPREVLTAHGLAPNDVDSAPYRAWVATRVQTARACFADGRAYLAGVPCRRCRVAGFAYLRRFEQVLDVIERDKYRLRPSYPESLSPIGLARLSAEAFWMALTPRTRASGAAA